MDAHRIDHVALHVESLRQAENFYARLFGMEVLYREGNGGGRLRRLPSDDWEALEASGTMPQRSLLGRGGFRLALRRATAEFPSSCRLEHIGLSVGAAEVEGVGARALELGCRVERAWECGLRIEDPYGVCWMLTMGERKSEENNETV